MPELSELAAGRSSFYEFLNLFFTRLPDAGFVRQLRQTHIIEGFRDLATDAEVHPDLAEGWMGMQSFLEETRNMPAEGLAQALGVDRTRLYRGVSNSFGPPPPYEAVWAKGGGETGNVLARITALYGEAGLVTGGDLNERADYIGTELDYLSQMARREGQAWESGDREIAGAIARQELAFAKSMCAWVPRFIDQAAEFAQTDFYRGHMQMVKGFLADELGRLEALVQELQATAA
jgi:TorA maturation chaperone TorD